MTSPEAVHDDLSRLYRRLALICAMSVLALGLVVLVLGWILGVVAFRSPIPGAVSMKANTALTFAMSALALLLLFAPVSRPIVRGTGLAAAAVVALMGTVTLAEYAWGADLGIDQVLVRDIPGAVATAEPGRMAPNTALAFVLVGIGLLTIDLPARWFSAGPTLAAATIGFIGSVGYVLRIPPLYAFGDATSMAVHTAVGFMVLALAILLARPDRDPIVRLTWQDAGGIVARILLPAVLLVFVAVTWAFQVITHDDGATTRSDALLLANVTVSLLLASLIWLLSGKLHRAETELRAASESRIRKSEELVREKDRFLASVSHELRTPVTAVVGFAELLTEMGEELEGEERTRILETMARQGEDLVALLDDLLVAARSDTGTLCVARVKVSLRAQVAQALESLAVERPNVEVVEGGETLAEGDPLRVRQILRNLLTNAYRYGGDSVRIRFDAEDDWAIVQVCDNGEGMPPEKQLAAFDPYSTLRGEMGRPGSIGLGLPVARGLAVRMGGDLRYRYQDGWSIFELRLPRLAVTDSVSAEQLHELTGATTD